MKFPLADALFPPVSDALLKKNNFFELYPLDGGGNFITRELFNTLDDQKIVSRLREAMTEFGGLPELDFKRFERWRSIEKSCWLNRCYFLISLTRVAWLNHDPTLGRTAVEVMLYFHRNFPPPPDLKSHWARVLRRMNEDYNGKSREEIIKDETDVEYIWYDFQPGQRLISFLYALYFIRDFDIFTQEECDEITACLQRHVRVLYEQESTNPLQKNNHQSVRVLALYWGYPLMAQERDCQQIHDLAKERCIYEGLNLFLPSGLEFENSPSYHAFVMWHLRDFKILADRRNDELPESYDAVIRSAVKVLFVLCRPDGKLLTINDSYQCSVTALIKSMGQCGTADSFEVINPGGIAVGYAGKCYVAMDVSAHPGGYSHVHGGKNAPTILWDKIPFVDDVGCPNYDAPQFPKCKQSEWHSSMLVDGKGDSHLSSLYGFDSWCTSVYASDWSADHDGGHSFTAILTSTDPAWQGVKWTRKVTVRPDGVCICDDVTCDTKQHIYTLLYNLGPDVAIETTAKENHWILSRSGSKCSFIVTPEEGGQVSAVIGTLENCQEWQIRKTSQLQLSSRNCRHFSCRTEFIFTS